MSMKRKKKELRKNGKGDTPSITAHTKIRLAHENLKRMTN